jgi:hypothetical protein
MHLIRKRLLLSILAKRPLFDFISLVKHSESINPTEEYDHSEFNNSTNPSTPNPRAQKRICQEDHELSDPNVPEFVYSPSVTDPETKSESPSRNSILTVLDSNIDMVGKMTQEELSDLKFVTKIFNIGLAVQGANHVGIDMFFYHPDDTALPVKKRRLIYPTSFDSLSKMQQHIVIELVKEAMNGRFRDGNFVGNFSEDEKDF